MDKYNRQHLEQLGIYELRTIARDVGVKSPTSKRHKDLVDCILKIQNGEQAASSSKKGRPPKKLSLATIANVFDCEKQDNLEPFKYVEEKCDGILFCDSDVVEGMNNAEYDCKGIIRDFNGKKYIYNTCNVLKYIYIHDDFAEKNNLKPGDFVYGKAYSVSVKTGILSKVIEINFKNCLNFSGVEGKKIQIDTISNIYNIYNRINEQSEKTIKIVVELEIEDGNILFNNDDVIYFNSKEMDDIRKSYNVLLDCLQLVKILSENNKPFSLYIIDIDYIFNILNVLLSQLNPEKTVDIDAGQFIKNLLAYIKKSNGGNAIIYESENYKRNNYLDAILNKYV